MIFCITRTFISMCVCFFFNMIYFWNLSLLIIASSVTAITDSRTFVPPENNFQLIDNAGNTKDCICVNIEDCAPYVFLLKRTPTSLDDLKRIQGSTCGFLGTQPYVCCPKNNDTDVNNTNDSNKTSSVGGFSFDDDNTLFTLESNDEHVSRPSRGYDSNQPNNQNIPQNAERKITTVIKTTISSETIITSFIPTLDSNISNTLPAIEPRGNNDDDLIHKKLLFPDNCGVVYNEEIHGYPKNKNLFPWVARLGYREKNVPEYVYRCGGVLINNRYVLTAAYCTIHDHYKLSTIRLGEYDSRVETDCDPPHTCDDFRQDFRPEKIERHEEYDFITMKNDIALIRLDKDVQFSIDVKPICLPFHLNEQRNAKQEILGVVAGWGITDIQSEASIPYLQYGLVQIVQSNFCTHQDLRKNNFYLCVRSFMKKTLDINDNGGPLMIEDKVINKNILIPRYYTLGIGSFNRSEINSEGYNSKEYYRVYTSTVNYLDWILRHVFR